MCTNFRKHYLELEVTFSLFHKDFVRVRKLYEKTFDDSKKL